MKAVVYVVAKAPQPGVSKTRLSPPLTLDQAADLSRAFLLDTPGVVAAAGLEARLICRDQVERRALERLTTGCIPAQPQTGRGLGDALVSAFRLGLTGRYDAVAVLGSDSPTLSPVTLFQGIALLRGGAADVTLGPCDDGGYYFLGARQLHESLFGDMPWGTGGVCAETLARAATAGLRTHLLDRWYDVDDAASLSHLRCHLGQLPMQIAPHTRLALAAMDEER